MKNQTTTKSLDVRLPNFYKDVIMPEIYDL